ncbi:hypothetical protein RCH06_001617 [Polaromonas sp. CG_9.5]|uniref:DUF1631 family protein n=1 Tax=Polaromonas sp. CG_9.5 TaxID=3071705 RepID=UPI002DF86001|nr:hypothetical protein [Polaromonas sp. CG_9.5]
MTTALQVPGAAFQSCIDEAVKRAPFLIDRWSTRLVEAIYARSMTVPEPTERHQLQNVIMGLKKNRLLMETTFPVELKKSIADDFSAGSAQKTLSSAGSLSSVSFDELELMQDDQVQEAVERARVQQVIRLGCEAGLASFTARLSTARGFLVVKADSNPLRPEIMTQALLRTLQTLPVSSQTRTAWLVDGAKLMGEELQLMYVQLNEFLAAQGMAPAAYGVSSMLETKSMPGFSASNDHSGNPRFEPESGRAQDGVPSASRKQLLTLDHLHRLLTGDYDNSHPEHSSSSGYELEEVSHPEFSHTLPFALDVLPELEEKARTAKGARFGQLAPAPSLAELRAHLKTDAKSPGQSLAIEVVSMMIEQMAQDERLLLPVRQVIAGAEPAFLRLAVTDPRFFSDKTHPARRLLDTITSTSLGYASESAPGFQEFMQSLQEVAHLLAEEHASDAQHFSELLRNFERKQRRNTPENRQAQRRAVQALVQAEERNLLAIKIAAEIRVRPDFVDRHPLITGFLVGPWAQVMAKERLQKKFVGAVSAQPVYSQMLEDLFWSLDVAPSTEQRRQLVKVIPEMLKLLREGLESIDYPLEQSRGFFDALMVVHQASLKPPSELPAAPSGSIHSMQKMFESEDDAEGAPLWLAPKEVEHSGFMDDWADSLPAEPESAPQPALPKSKSYPASSAVPGSGASVRLHVGDWVELLVDMQWVRAQLTWVSPHDTLFMFDSEGGRKHSMTCRVLNHLLELELVKVVSQQGVLDGALDSVARTAMRNSVEGEGNGERNGSVKADPNGAGLR